MKWMWRNYFVATKLLYGYMLCTHTILNDKRQSGERIYLSVSFFGIETFFLGFATIYVCIFVFTENCTLQNGICFFHLFFCSFRYFFFHFVHTYLVVPLRIAFVWLWQLIRFMLMFISDVGQCRQRNRPLIL